MCAKGFGSHNYGASVSCAEVKEGFVGFELGEFNHAADDGDGAGDEGGDEQVLVSPSWVVGFVLGDVGVFFALGAFGFAAFDAALGAEFEVFFFVFVSDGGCGFLAQSAGFGAAFFFAQGADVFADVLDIFGFEDGSVGAD